MKPRSKNIIKGAAREVKGKVKESAGRLTGKRGLQAEGWLEKEAGHAQRKLGEAGTTYKEILDDTRRELALAYLSTPRHSVSDVTYLLGFSAGSCFTRAFRRWTGCSPSDWRAGRAVSTQTQRYLPNPRNLSSPDFGLPDLTLSL